MKNMIYGIYDWDDNILHMPTLIKAYDNDVKKFTWLTTEQYAKIRKTDHHLTFDSNAFDLFYDYIPSNFVTDIERALALETYGPSFKRFVKMIKAGQLIAIVTARGHEPETIRNGVKYLISRVFSTQDTIEWHRNLRKYRKMFDLSDVDDIELEETYWSDCYFIGLGRKKDQIGEVIRQVEDQKKQAIKDFVDVIFKKNKGINLPIKIGFSDDDVSNLQKVHELFTDLLNIYPMIKFRLYDTSDRQMKKIIVSDAKHS